MTTIPILAVDAAMSAETYVNYDATDQVRLTTVLEAALPYLHTVESYGLWTSEAYPGWVAMPNKDGGVDVWNRIVSDGYSFRFTPESTRRGNADTDTARAAQFARAYFQAHAPKCGEPCPFMDNLYCGFEPGHHEAHRIITGAGMVVTWLEAASE